MTITTPSGYKVSFKDKLDYGDKRFLKKLMLSKMKIRPSVDEKTKKFKQESLPMSMEFQVEIEEATFKRAIQSIEIGEKTYTENLLERVFSWDEEDGDAVFNFLNEQYDPMGTNPDQQEKKTENYN